MVTVSVQHGKLQQLFSTPLITDELPFAGKLNAGLEPLILAKRGGQAGHQLSNRGGWQSEHDLLNWGGEPAKQLRDRALLLADAYTVGPPPSPGRSRWRCEAWANVSGSGHFNMPHVHSATFWSVVYYLRVGEGSGGQLVLHDPRMPGIAMHAPHLGFRRVGAQGVFEIEPKPGLMVLFPGWLLHSVEPWHGTGERISVAMNIRARTMIDPTHLETQAER